LILQDSGESQGWLEPDWLTAHWILLLALLIEGV
jgi:hypothetical protein